MIDILGWGEAFHAWPGFAEILEREGGLKVVENANRQTLKKQP
jgi:hypothetical protein